MKILKSLKNFLVSLFISTNHWLVRVVTTTMDQLGIGMLLILILKFLQNQRKKFHQNCELEHNFKNLPFSLILLAIGWVGINIASFSAGFFVVSEILEIQSGSRVLNEIPFEDLILDADTGIWRNYTYDPNIFNAELYRDSLRHVGSRALTEDFKDYDNLISYRRNVATAFNQRATMCFNEMFQRAGHLGGVASLSVFLEAQINYMGESFKTSMEEFRGQVVVTPILEQKLQVLMNYGRTSLEDFQQQRVEMMRIAMFEIHDRLAEEDIRGANKVVTNFRREIEVLYFQTYQINIEMNTFFKNLSKEYCQGVTPLDNRFPFVEVHEAGNLDRIPMQIVIDKKILCDDDVYCPKEGETPFLYNGRGVA